MSSGLDFHHVEFVTPVLDAFGRLIENKTGQAMVFLENFPECEIEMVAIPGGDFLMGTPEAGLERLKRSFAEYVPGFRVAEWALRQTPQYAATVPAFLLGHFPVTQNQWKAVASWSPVNRELHPSPSFFSSDGNLPVETVTWEEASEFCDRLCRATGHHYRLPTEVEWEYACRAGTTTEFAFGDNITSECVNFDGNFPYDGAPKSGCRHKTTPVGSLECANFFGLCDMHGNVWEWCQDTWHTRYDGAPADGTAWIEDGDPVYRIIRGGSWWIRGAECRSATRDRVSAHRGNKFVGLRVAMEMPTGSETDS